ncbi:MAG: S1 RNA-binding domain-containing protein [Clostridia bacterium]|nr:S1 RNA-binding domain-containing protein [Clostridia bacterium]MBQ3057416.1 S1 RNA-binding domain-containing protein [Clostridia bacterium]
MNGFYPEGKLYNTQENKRYMLSPASLLDAQIRGVVLEAAVLMCDTDHNLIVNLGCMRGIIPRNEGAIGIESGATRDIALISRVGKPVCFVISEIKSDKNGDLYAVLSRKKAQQLCKSYIESEYKTGQVINTVVTHLESFGAFCDIGCGNIALLPIDAISVSRISHPKDRFKVGDNIKAVIKNIADDGKITLSHKELLGTWEENAREFSAGQTVTGVIRSVEDYGIFVEITPNLAGLAEPKENVRVGQQASVFIKSILKDKMKIKLIIIDSFESSYIPEIKYYNTEEVINEWEYSPKDCRKQITTRFCG